jgi:hypothetical protein
MFAAMAGAGIASHIASINMGTNVSVLFAVNSTVDGVRAGLTPAQIYERYLYGVILGTAMTYGVMFGPGVIAGVINSTPQGIQKFIADRYTGMWNLLPQLNGRVGRWIADSGRKKIYAYGNSDDLVIAVAKERIYAAGLYNELDVLGKLDCMGFPVPKILGTLMYRGRPAYVMEKFAQGSKEIVRIVNYVPSRVISNGQVTYLNQRSIQELKAIKQMMIQKKFQLMISSFLSAKMDGL